MMNSIQKTMIKAAVAKLTDWIKTQGGTVELSDSKISAWLHSEGYNFTVEIKEGAIKLTHTRK